ncbi:hypothetical protein HY522_00325 [bacterium]|nr:hypothetical protein [bacterium]
MAVIDDLNSSDDYMRSTAASYRCEECGYKWKVKESGMDDEADELSDTVSYDANDDVEPSSCPLCGCSDILTL